MLDDITATFYRPLQSPSINIERQRVQHSGTSFGRGQNDDVVGHDDAAATTISDEESGFCMRVPRAEVFGLFGGALTSDDFVRKEPPYSTTTHAGRCHIITCVLSHLPFIRFSRETKRSAPPLLYIYIYVLLCVLRVETAREAFATFLTTYRRGKTSSCLFPLRFPIRPLSFLPPPCFSSLWTRSFFPPFPTNKQQLEKNVP